MKSENSRPRFRRAGPSVADAIQRLYHELVDDPNINVTKKCIGSLEIDPGNFLIVGEWDSEPIATAFVTFCRDVMYEDQPFAVLENIVVDRRFRGKGIGEALMQWIKELCKAHRCTKIMLLSSSKRKEAHSFFQNCGYRGDLKVGFVNYLNRI